MAELVPTGLKPLDVDGVTASIVGTVAWAIAFVVYLLRWDTLVANNDEWQLWACVAGVLIGVIGVAYTSRRRTKLAARE